MALTVAGTTVGLASTAAGAADGDITRAAVRHAAAKTLAASSERVALDEQQPLLGAEVTTHKTALVSRAKNESSVTTRVGPVHFGPKSPAGTLDLPESSSGPANHELYIDGASYLDLGSSDTLKSVTGGKRWLRIPKLPDSVRNLVPNLPEFPGGSGLGDLTQRLNPAEPYFALLRALTGPVTSKGKAQLGDRSAVHYRAVLDYSKLGVTSLSAEQSTAHLAGKTPVDAWIDRDGRLIKLHMKVAQAALGQAAALDPGDTVVTLEASQFGRPVVVEPPPADQVFDLSQVGQLHLPDLGTPTPTIPDAPSTSEAPIAA